MELDNEFLEENKFEIEKEPEKVENILGTETGTPPLVVVVQGGKNV